jgi:hypothetical protein
MGANSLPKITFPEISAINPALAIRKVDVDALASPLVRRMASFIVGKAPLP